MITITRSDNFVAAPDKMIVLLLSRCVYLDHR